MRNDNKSKYKKFINNTELIIFDDVFPHPVSGFRYEEFTVLLQKIPNTILYTTGTSVKWLGDTELEELVKTYHNIFPETIPNVKMGLPVNGYPDSKLLYCVFLQNAYYGLLHIAETNKIPFVFTLYPGGGFSLGAPESDRMLEAVLKSPWLAKVIVTQKVTYDYLLSKNYCGKDKIKMIFGVVIPQNNLQSNKINKKYFGKDKETLDICFVAHRYCPKGEDKGYDTFIQVAKGMSRIYNNVMFHVVGNWDDTIIDVSDIDNIKFCGIQSQEWFDKFYENIDILISPNKPGQIYQGSFDGFPTGCATDAALRKVAMFVSDPLMLNQGHFEDGVDLVIIDNDADHIIEKIKIYYNEPGKIEDLCNSGYNKVKALYNYKNQMQPRINILLDEINKSDKFKKDIANRYNKINTWRYQAGLYYMEHVPDSLKKVYRLIKNIFIK